MKNVFLFADNNSNIFVYFYKYDWEGIIRNISILLRHIACVEIEGSNCFD